MDRRELIQPKPAWLRVQYNQADTRDVRALMDQLDLHTVCREANCPNLGECYRSQTATFMILGSTCTRACPFCNVTCGRPAALDPEEPEHVARAAARLGLKHVVVTSVTRDDLKDGGASVFADVIHAVRQMSPSSTIEVLIPDLKGQEEALRVVLDAQPDVLNHNVECVPRLYPSVRPQAIYQRSLDLLQRAKSFGLEHPGPNGPMVVKTGMMLGLGETEAELRACFQELVAHGVDVLTLGQYLRPSPAHVPVVEYVTPEAFQAYGQMAEDLGVIYCASSPLVRSSYRAGEALERVRQKQRSL